MIRTRLALSIPGRATWSVLAIEHQYFEPGSIEEELRFFKPFRSKAKVSFQFEPADEGNWHLDDAV